MVFEHLFPTCSVSRCFYSPCAVVLARIYGFKTIGLRQINSLAATFETLDEQSVIASEARQSRPAQMEPTNQVYNVAVGDRTTLNQLYEQLHLNLLSIFPHLQGVKPVYRDFRGGDVRHSLAYISKSSMLLEYQPTHRIGDGLKVAMDWYIKSISANPKPNN